MWILVKIHLQNLSSNCRITWSSLTQKKRGLSSRDDMAGFHTTAEDKFIHLSEFH